MDCPFGKDLRHIADMDHYHLDDYVLAGPTVRTAKPTAAILTAAFVDKTISLILFDVLLSLRGDFNVS